MVRHGDCNLSFILGLPSNGGRGDFHDAAIAGASYYVGRAKPGPRTRVRQRRRWHSATPWTQSAADDVYSELYRHLYTARAAVTAECDGDA